MKMNCAIKSYSVLIIIILLSACKTTPVLERIKEESDPYSEPLLEVNRYIKERNRDQIVAFIDRSGWIMTETSTGLWYMIMEQGSGPLVQEGDFVVYSYKTRLLSGTYCYSADTINPKTIVIGKGNVEAGVEEGLLLLNENSKARFIIPPHLAHGNFGDRDKIPGTSNLIVDINVLMLRR